MLALNGMHWETLVEGQHLLCTPVLDVAQVGIRVMTFELGRLDPAHHRGGALACAQRACDYQLLRPMAIGRILFSICLSAGRRPLSTCSSKAPLRVTI